MLHFHISYLLPHGHAINSHLNTCYIYILYPIMVIIVFLLCPLLIANIIIFLKGCKSSHVSVFQLCFWSCTCGCRESTSTSRQTDGQGANPVEKRFPCHVSNIYILKFHHGKCINIKLLYFHLFFTLLFKYSQGKIFLPNTIRNKSALRVCIFLCIFYVTIFFILHIADPSFAFSNFVPHIKESAMPSFNQHASGACTARHACLDSCRLTRFRLGRDILIKSEITPRLDMSQALERKLAWRIEADICVRKNSPWKSLLMINWEVVEAF